MHSITCQHCRESFPTESMQFGGFRCPKCGERVDVRVNNQSPLGCETTRDELVEIIHFPFWSAIARSMWSAVVFTTLTAAIIVSMFIAINLFAGMGANLQRLLALPRAALMFFGFSWCFVAVVGFPFAFLMSWRWRPRRICVDEDDLVVETAGKTLKMSLDECIWYVAKMGFDTSGAYFPRARIIIVQQRPKRLEGGQKPFAFACGFSDQSFRMWSDFFTASCVHQRTKNATLILLMALVVGTTLGGMFAVPVGLGIEAIAGIPLLAAAIGFLGWLDGGVTAVLWYCLAVMQREDFDVWLRKQMGPVSICLGFAAVGFTIGRIAGLLAAVQLAAVNGIVGLAIYLCLRKVWLRDDSQMGVRQRNDSR